MNTIDEVNPEYVVAVVDFTPETLDSVIAHLEVSSSFEHLVYREAELDAVWTQLAFAIFVAPDEQERERLKNIRSLAHNAHDLVAARNPAAAAAILRQATYL